MAVKHIRTYYNNEKTIIRMIGCHQCPLMKFDEKLRVCECRYFQLHSNNILKDSITTFNKETKKVLEFIDFPDWCRLPNTYLDMCLSESTYTLTFAGISVNMSDKSKNIKLVDACDHDYDVYNVTNYRRKNGLVSLPSSNIEDYGEIENMYKNFDDAYKPKTVVKKEICSLCGEEDESVNRFKNNGMCEDCFELSTDDQYKQNQAFIANFRLKRNVKTDLTVQFKQLKEINS